MNPEEHIAAKAFKLGSAWAFVGVTSWADAASLLACLYTAALFGEWLWKKVIRPIARHHGWIAIPKDEKEKDDE